jgi:hypothetical protein
MRCTHATSCTVVMVVVVVVGKLAGGWLERMNKGRHVV